MAHGRGSHAQLQLIVARKECRPNVTRSPSFHKKLKTCILMYQPPKFSVWASNSDFLKYYMPYKAGLPTRVGQRSLMMRKGRENSSKNLRMRW